MKKLRVVVIVWATLVLAGCGEEMPTGDGGTSTRDGQVTMDSSVDGGGGGTCARDSECDDGTFCNGEERCMPGADGADANGCLPGDAPCDAETELCNEDESTCELDECSDGGDADGDGDARPACGGGDCDDDDGSVNSSAQEVCDADGVDEDCNPETIYNSTAGMNDGDTDSDGFVADGCFNTRDDGTENRGRDCDDSRGGVNPGAVDSCGGGDEDCDGTIDEEPSTTYYYDADGDGHGVNTADSNVLACSPPSDAYTLLEGDCDETRPGVHPGVPEICNGLDDNCDGSTDPGCSCLEGETQDCGPPTSNGICVRSTRTCTSAGAWPTGCPGAVYPETEVCGGGDEDCDGTTDEAGAADVTTYYLDADHDGFGDPGTTARVCPSRVSELGDAYVTNSQDCNDSNPAINPLGTEACNGVDDNCSTVIDDVPGGCDCLDGDSRSCGESTGDCELGMQTCTAGGWGACVGGVGPRTESCGGGDEDCDGSTDEGVTNTYWRDADLDGHGDSADEVMACTAPTGYVDTSAPADCDDMDSNKAPSLNEADYPCDMKDNNCNGIVDEAGTNEVTCYRDRDGDGHGDPGSTHPDGDLCSCPTDWVAAGDDCDDTGSRAGLIFPGSDFRAEGHCGGGPTCSHVSTGEPACVVCTTPSLCLCSGADDFEYNCDSSISIEGPTGACVRRSAPLFGCSTTQGWQTTPGAAECGTTQTWVTSCAYDGSTGDCVVSGTEMRTVRCR